MIANNKGSGEGRLWLAIRDIPFGNIGENRWLSRWVFQSRFIYSDGLFAALSCIALDAPFTSCVSQLLLSIFALNQESSAFKATLYSGRESEGH